MKIDVTQIIVGIAMLIMLIVTRYVIPWLKAKTGKTNWETICKWAKTFVEGVEVLIEGTKMGEEKRNKVMQMLREECETHNITYNESEIRLALEEAWANMVKKKNKSVPTTIKE
jgi:LL-H family phage holin